MPNLEDSVDKRMQGLLPIALVVFTSAIGATLLPVAIASSIYKETGSATSSVIVFLLQYLPAPILIKLIWRTTERTSPRLLLLFSCLAVAGISCLIGVLYRPTTLSVVYILLAMRGVAECVIKQCRSVYVKLISRDFDVGSNSTIVLLFEFAGQAFGAIIATLSLGRMSLLEICIIDVMFFVIAAALSLRLANVDTEKNGVVELDSLSEVAARIWQTPEQFFYFGMLICTVITFQSINQTLRTWLPLEWLGLGMESAGTTEAISLAGIVVGIVVASRWIRKDSFSGTFLAGAMLMAILMLPLVFFSHSFVVSQGAYFFYMIVFEVCIAYSMAGMLAKTPKNMLKGTLALFYAASYGGLCLTGLVFSCLTDRIGLNIVAYLVSAAALFISILLLFRLNSGFESKFWRSL